MISIIAILESQTIPGITANNTAETNADFSQYISFSNLVDDKYGKHRKRYRYKPSG